MKIFVNIIFLAAIIYNFTKRNKNIFKAKLAKPSLLGFLFILVFGFFIWFSKDKSPLGFFIVISASLYFLSIFLSCGIGEGYFLSYRQKLFTPLKVDFDKLSSIRITYKEDELILEILAYGDFLSQRYPIQISDEILGFLQAKGLDIEVKKY